MNTTTPSQKNHAARYLKASGRLWFLVTITGQWIFFYYILMFYGSSVIEGNLEIWNRWEPLGSKPYKAGDTSHNVAFASHALGAGIVAFGGALQLIPWFRYKYPIFHRWNGRVYILTVISLALSGFYLVWVKGASPSFIQELSTSFNGMLILTFAALAVHRARRGEFQSHSQWALRLFLVSNAQWFLRVGVFCYMILATLMGFQPSLEDPFFIVWTFGCYLLPLALLQLYFLSTKKDSAYLKWFTGVSLTALSVLMIIGIIGLTPFLQKVISGQALTF